MAVRIFTPEQDVRIAARYADGALLRDLAADAGTSVKAVRNALKRAGCPARNKSEATAHRNRLRRDSGQPHPNWRGGRRVDSDGYVRVRVDPSTPFVRAMTSGSEILEHRLVMAQAIGRALLPHETVHHINEDRADNRLENLQLRVGRHGKGGAYQCRSCGSHDVEAIELGAPTFAAGAFSTSLD